MKNIMILAVAMTLSVSVSAQRSVRTQRSPEEIAARKTERMQRELDLSGEQLATIRDINAQHASRIAAIRLDSAREKEIVRSEVRSIRLKHQEEIAKVLTPEQKTKWETLKKERRAQAAQRKGNGKHDRRSAVKEKLSLSDEQAGKLNAAQNEFRDKLRAVRADSTITTESKTAKFTALKAAHEDKVRTILTEEQFAQWTEMKNKQRDRKKGLRKNQYFDK